ncbi:hypothetical protein CLV40_107189 [Actinokineospora auranticolor]|uniref:Uncharacterized protein n=1 Tax=Actinokineospora auranticolor TaxID=155976 RepID=A0A2S6GQJ2_9PSEU|nr:hypothetical protein CLV40_107189 [Actinokineospora auranticolor]
MPHLAPQYPTFHHSQRESRGFRRRSISVFPARVRVGAVGRGGGHDRLGLPGSRPGKRETNFETASRIARTACHGHEWGVVGDPGAARWGVVGRSPRSPIRVALAPSHPDHAESTNSAVHPRPSGPAPATGPPTPPHGPPGGTRRTPPPDQPRRGPRVLLDAVRHRWVPGGAGTGGPARGPARRTTCGTPVARTPYDLPWQDRTGADRAAAPWTTLGTSPLFDTLHGRLSRPHPGVAGDCPGAGHQPPSRRAPVAPGEPDSRRDTRRSRDVEYPAHRSAR